MELKQFEGKTVKEMKVVDMKLVITFTDGQTVTVSSEDKYCGLELQ